jgi:predicted kinase
VNSKPKLYFTVGTAASAKSTFAQKWKRELANTPRVVVTTDNIRLALHNQVYNKCAEPLVFAQKYIMLKTLLLEGYDVLSCGTHTTKESIQRILEIDPNAEPIVIGVPLHICLERSKLRGDAPYMESVIKRQHGQIQDLLAQGIENVLAELKEKIKKRWQAQSESY